MSDGLPTDEQLRRIERGVQRRIDLRRAAAHRLVGATAAVALLGGGFALLVPLALGTGAGGGTATSAGGSAASSAADVRTVVCHAASARGSAAVQRRAPAGTDDQRLIEACGGSAVEFQSGSGRLPSDASGGGSGTTDRGTEGTAAPTASSTAAPTSSGEPLTSGSASPSPGGPAVLCIATDDVLHVFPADDRPATLCARNGMRAG